MNKIKINNLVQQLRNADFVEVVGEYESVWVAWDGEAKGDPDNEILLLTWTVEGNEGPEYGFILTEQGLNDAEVQGNSIILKDNTGEKIHLRLWERTCMKCAKNLKLGNRYHV